MLALHADDVDDEDDVDGLIDCLSSSLQHAAAGRRVAGFSVASGLPASTDAITRQKSARAGCPLVVCCSR